MKEVNIYLQTTVRGPRKVKHGIGMYVIECVVNNVPHTVHEKIKYENTYEVIMVLDLLIRALERLTQNAKIRIFTQCEHISSAFKCMWFIKWEKNQWKNEKGIEVKNAEKWKQIINLLKNHTYTVSKEDHPYKSWMLEEIRKEK